MTLLGLLLVLVVIGVILFFLDRATIIDATICRVIWWVLIVAAILIVLHFFGVLSWMKGVDVPRL